jgi:hypothetical protein
MLFEVHHHFHLSPEATAQLERLNLTGEQIVEGLNAMSEATDHLKQAVTDLQEEVADVVTKLEDISSDTEDEAAASAIDAVVAQLKGAGTTASTTVEQTPPDAALAPSPDQSSLTADEVAAGVKIDGSGNKLNADGSPFVEPSA